MVLAIDVGNTQLKLAVFEQNTIIHKEIVPYQNWESQVNFFLINYKKIKVIVIASVGKLSESSFNQFKDRVIIYFISLETKFPFQNLYSTPHTLGIDRMVLAAGAVFNFPNLDRLVIDAGTCITYDFIDVHNNYCGGAISPGIRLRYQAMHNYTAKLPLLEKEDLDYVVGNSTNQSLHSGVINGIGFEIDGFINSFCKNKENFIIILTGGDADFLAKRLKNTIFANSNFLLESLNLIYRYNHDD